MKQVITNYTFSTSGKTITLTDFSSSHPVDLKRLYLITDVKTNKILYNFADNNVSNAVISGVNDNIITLSALQGGESNSDSLQIIYEVLSTDPTYETPLLPSNASQESGGNLTSIASSTSSIANAVSGFYLQDNIAQINGSTVNTAASGTILVGNADGSGNKLTSNSTATSGKTGLDSNILSILGTAPTTAGYLDIKGADGNVFVRQTTAANLNATAVLAPATSGGLTILYSAAPAGGNSSYSVKGSAGQVYGWYMDNSLNGATTYVNFYNSSSPTVGSSIAMSISIPSGAATNIMWAQGVAFSTAIAISVTTTRIGTTAPGSAVNINIFGD